MPYETILTENEDGVLILTFNRPEKLNSLDARLLREASDVLRDANQDDEVKVAIITGAGRAFCSGADLSASVSGIKYNQPDINRNIRLQPYIRYGWLIEQIEACGKPQASSIFGIDRLWYNLIRSGIPHRHAVPEPARAMQYLQNEHD